MPSPLSLLVALAAELEASEARARRAEGQLAAHDSHCICRAAEITAEDAVEPMVAKAGGTVTDGGTATAPKLDVLCIAA